MLLLLYSGGMYPLYPLNTRVGGTQSRSGHWGLKKSLLSLPGIKKCPSLHRLGTDVMTEREGKLKITVLNSSWLCVKLSVQYLKICVDTEDKFMLTYERVFTAYPLSTLEQIQSCEWLISRGRGRAER
jgi:hypothetical protein